MKPLTDEEILELMRKYPDHLSQNSARAIEAAVNAKWEAENKRLREVLALSVKAMDFAAGATNKTHVFEALRAAEIAARAALKGDV